MMSFTVHRLLDILEVIVPYKHFQKLRDFINLKLLPDRGFPVKLSKKFVYCNWLYVIYKNLTCSYRFLQLNLSPLQLTLSHLR